MARPRPGLAVRGGGRRVDFHAIASGLGPIARRRHPASAGNHLAPERNHDTVMNTALLLGFEPALDACDELLDVLLGHAVEEALGAECRQRAGDVQIATPMHDGSFIF